MNSCYLDHIRQIQRSNVGRIISLKINYGGTPNTNMCFKSCESNIADNILTCSINCNRKKREGEISFYLEHFYSAEIL